MSRFVHPDKNKDDIERSQQAFEAVNKAYKMLTDSEVASRCKQVIEEARRRLSEEKLKAGLVFIHTGICWYTDKILTTF